MLCRLVQDITPLSNTLAAWFAELRRLAGEAEERFVSGDIRPAMTSLAGVPMIHSMLMQGCGELADPSDAGPDDSNIETPGMYL